MAFVSYRVLRSRVEWRQRAALGAAARRRARDHPLLHLPARPRRQGGGRAAERRRHPDRRLAQHAAARDQRRADGSTATPTRADRVRQTFANPDSPIDEGAVGEVPRPHRSGSRRRPRGVSAPGDLTFGGTQTRLANAIESARQELAGLPVSGLVLVTDGADTTDATVADALLASKAKRCRSSPSASGRKRSRTTSRSAASRRRARR